MKPGGALVSAFALLVALGTASAAVHYVNLNSSSPASPYLDWSTAATNIQQAVDVALAGDQVLVSNGVYQAGGRAIFGTMTNRVAITRAIMVQSVNGPAVTSIQGYQLPGTLNGDGAIRCVYLTNGALLSGFTLTNGATRSTGDTNRERSGGGLWCVSTNAWASNCVIVANSADYFGGGVYLGSLIDCTLSSNSVTLPWYGSGGGAFSNVLIRCSLLGNSAANNGGGAYFSILRDCTLAGNWISFDSQGALAYGNGGGAYRGSLTNCVLTGNRTYAYGGGTYYASLTNCILSGNVARVGGGSSGGSLYGCTLTGNCSTNGGGASGSLLVNCILTGNCATNSGGGAGGGTLINCLFTGNSALTGGGAYVSYTSVTNCTFTGNSATTGGGCAAGASTYFNNCILYFNTALNQPDVYSGTLYNCCTPGIAATNGNIAADPLLASASHLSADSPCRGAGNPASTSGSDIDGEPWSNPPSIGCDEYRIGTVTGPLSVGISASFTNVTVGCADSFAALITGKASASVWDFGDGTVVSNQPWTSHAWSAPGDYPVILRAYNETWPAGVSATLLVHVDAAPIHYVNASSSHPVAPYTTWSTAAADIQSAVDAATTPGAIILVTNGTYNTGGKTVSGSLLNRVATTMPLQIRSVNGPDVTSVCGYQLPGTTNGDGAVRCVSLCNGSALSGFTLTHGATRSAGDSDREQSGGALWCESTNAAASNCVMIANSAYGSGGAAYHARLDQCILAGNTAYSGGGTVGGLLNGCVLSNNVASSSGGGAISGILNGCTITANSSLGFGGGGVYGGRINNCAINDNYSAQWGGGAIYSTLNNCTLTGNSASSQGGGVYGATLNNSIIYFNTAPIGPNCYGGTPNYCCTTPLAAGIGNFSQDPLLASASHLSSLSPCRGAGNSLYISGADIDGEAWQSPPTVGCDEYMPGSVTGALAVAISPSLTNGAFGIPINFTARIAGRTVSSVWDFGDGAQLTNQPYASHAWTALGDYPVVLRAFNETWPSGISATCMVHIVLGPTLYVAAGNLNPVPPYSSWATAAADIQSAVDAAAVPGSLILVSNGIYATGGKVVVGSLTNRVAVDKPLTVQSVNGPAYTTIQGYQSAGATNGDDAVRCVYLTAGASISGFTLSGGATRKAGDMDHEQTGGGIWCELPGAAVSNCWLTGNAAAYHAGGAYNAMLTDCLLATNSAPYGGGVYYGTLNRCILTGNSLDGAYLATLTDCVLSNNTSTSGAGAWGCSLTRCTLTGNQSQYYGGAAYGCTLESCILSGNSATMGGGAYGSELNNCLLTNNTAFLGGGAYQSDLTNCTVAGNYGSAGGGTYEGTAYNSIVYFNYATNSGPNYSSTISYSSCVTPMPTNGLGNITNAPSFADQTAGDLRLASTSPCINSGRNAYETSTLDLDGNPRIAGGTVDIGAYEYPTPSSILSYAWAQRYGIPTDGSADFVDPDGDRMNNWQEWLAGTDPTNGTSTLKLLSIQSTNNPVGRAVSWQSVTGVSYYVQRNTNPVAPPAFVTLQSNIAAVSSTAVFVDTNAPSSGSALYRVGVQP